MSGACSDGNTMLQEKPAQLVDYGSSAANPTITHAMQGLQIQLRLVLDRDKSHRRSLNRFRDRFRIDIVVLVGLDEWPNILRGHDLDVVSLGYKSTSEEVGAGTSFDTDQTCR